MPDTRPPTDPRGVCGICKEPKPIVEGCLNTSPGVCDGCYAEGWRSGPEMMAAFRDDPLFEVVEPS